MYLPLPVRHFSLYIFLFLVMAFSFLLKDDPLTFFCKAGLLLKSSVGDGAGMGQGPGVYCSSLGSLARVPGLCSCPCYLNERVT